MLHQSPESDTPVGFTSFSQDLLPNGATRFAADEAAVDVSFADSKRAPDDCEEGPRRREMKFSTKKSELYLQIMREHGFTDEEIETKLSQTKVSYVIPALGEFQSTVQEAERPQKNLTITRPFDFQTSKRMRIQEEQEVS